MGEITFLRKNVFLAHPRIIQVELTTKCPLECPQCYKESSNMCEIDYNRLVKLLKENSQKHLKSIMINGGEPLLYSKFFSVLDECRLLGIRVFCFTSGITIDETQAKLLKGYNNLFLNISLNGSKKAINQLSRDGYEIALEAMITLRESEVPFGINWVARHDNVYDFPNMCILAEKMGANNILVINNKKAASGYIDSPLSNDDLEFLVEFISKHSKEHKGIEIIVQQCFGSLRSALYGQSSITLNNGCPAGRLFCTVNHNMQFQPCSHVNLPEKYNSIDEYWHNSEYLQRIRDNTKGEQKPICVSCYHDLKL